MDSYLLFTLLFLSLVLYTWIGQRASKYVKNSDEYYLMNKQLTFFPLVMTLLATQLGGGTLVGACDKAYFQGWKVLFYPLGNALGFIVLGLGVGLKLKNLKIKTTVEVFEKVYKSPAQKSIASILSILSMMFILIAQSSALKKLFISIGLTHPIYFIIFWLVLIFYTVLGGLKAVVDTDVIQALFIVLTLLIAFVIVYYTEFSVVRSFAEIRFDPINTEVYFTQWFLMPFLFTLIGQDMGQRYFSAKNSKIIFFSSLFAGILIFICSAISIYFGILARKYSVDFDSKSSILVDSIKGFTNPAMSSFFMVSIFMAIVSTVDSLVFAVSSNIFCDFIDKLQIKEKLKVNISKIITFCVGLFVLIFSFLFNSVIKIMIFSYSLSVCSLAVPILLAIFVKHPSKKASLASIILGSVCFIILNHKNISSYKEIIAISSSLFGYIIFHIYDKHIKDGK